MRGNISIWYDEETAWNIRISQILETDEEIHLNSRTLTSVLEIARAYGILYARVFGKEM